MENHWVPCACAGEILLIKPLRFCTVQDITSYYYCANWNKAEGAAQSKCHCLEAPCQLHLTNTIRIILLLQAV